MSGITLHNRRNYGMVNGAYLKQLRIKKNYTLLMLSKEIGCTASFLSQMERGLKKPSLAMLRKLSDFFEEPIVSLLSSDAEGDEAPEAAYSIIRVNERRAVEIPGLTIKSEAITTNRSHGGRRAMQGMVYTIAPDSYSSEGLVRHRFDECTYVLSGKIEACFSTSSESLEEGDCIYTNAMTPHNLKNTGTTDATVLSFNVIG